jgi:hypothetical protein
MIIIIIITKFFIAHKIKYKLNSTRNNYLIQWAALLLNSNLF